jgi:hypothetical protein
MPSPAADEPLLASPFLFRFAVPCQHHEPLWSPGGVQLDEHYCLPCFASLDQPADADQPSWADVRMAWSQAGLALNLRVRGKRQPPWCRASRIEDSDGLAIWINTRPTADMHRASRFCQAFRFLPSGAASSTAEPVAAAVAIPRARENPQPFDERLLMIRGEQRVDGYLLEAFLPAAVLTGYDPDEHSQLGFTYAVIDRELGQYVMTVGEPFPYDADPSLWSILELVHERR